jgi:hypothetical protein
MGIGHHRMKQDIYNEIAQEKNEQVYEISERRNNFNWDLKEEYEGI